MVVIPRFKLQSLVIIVSSFLTVVLTRNIYPISVSSEINAKKTLLQYHKTAAVSCEDSIRHDVIVQTLTDLKWDSKNAPFITPLLMCGTVETTVEHCPSAFATLTVTFTDAITKKNFILTQQSTAMPGRICIHMSSCDIWNAMNAQGFARKYEGITIKAEFSVKGVASPRQRYTLHFKGSALADRRQATKKSRPLPYQTSREGPAIYVIPWKNCDFGNSQYSCSPFLKVLPAYSALYRRFMFTTGNSNTFPICLGPPHEVLSPADKETLFNAIELGLEDTQEALYGKSDLLAAWSYLEQTS